jgi:hypothetical protein
MRRYILNLYGGVPFEENIETGPNSLSLVAFKLFPLENKNSENKVYLSSRGQNC